MSRRIVIGIDPGADGAVSAIDVDGRQVLGVARFKKWSAAPDGQSEALHMAADLHFVSVATRMLCKAGVVAGDRVEIVCEAPQMRPGQSGGSAQGWRAGVQAAAVVAGVMATPASLVSLTVVSAAVWTKEMGMQTDDDDTSEKASVRKAARKRARVARVLELCPAARLMLMPTGCRVEHDGAADAILIGLYGAGLGRRT